MKTIPSCLFVFTVWSLWCAWPARAAAEGPSCPKTTENAKRALAESDELERTGQPKLALAAAEQALATVIATYGPSHICTANALDAAAHLDRRLGHFSQARARYLRLQALYEVAFGKAHPFVTVVVNNLGGVASDEGNLKLAISHYEDALRRIRISGSNEKEYEGSFTNNLIDAYRRIGQVDKALDLIKKTESLQKQFAGTPLGAALDHSAGKVFHEIGNLEQAQLYYERSVALRKKLFVPQHPSLLEAISSLASLYADQGDEVTALELQKRAFQGLRNALGPDHPSIASSLNDIALTRLALGQKTQARQDLLEALRILNAVSAEDPRVATTKNNLATVERATGACNDAARLHEEILAERRKNFRRAPAAVVESLVNLGVALHCAGMTERAKSRFEEALKLQTSARTSNEHTTAIVHYSLGQIGRSLGDPKSADRHFTVALALAKRRLGPYHPQIASFASAIGYLRADSGQLLDAVSKFQDAARIRNYWFSKLSAGAPDGVLRSVLHDESEQTSYVVSLALAHPEFDRLQQLAATLVLSSKGRSLEAVRQQAHAALRRMSPADRADFDRLRQLTRELTRLTYEETPSIKRQRMLEESTREIDELWERLGARTAVLRPSQVNGSNEALLQRVQTAIPVNAVGVDYFIYQRQVPATSTRDPKEGPRYGAVIIRPSQTRLIDVASADEITESVKGFLEGVLGNSGANYRTFASTLYQLVVAPIEAGGERSSRLIVAPDGELTRVPFAAFRRGSRFLLDDDYDIGYLNGLRQLVEPSLTGASNRNVIAFADPNFKDSRFPAVPSTRNQTETIRKIFADVSDYLGPRATKEVLLNVASPGILHIATHGWYDRVADSSNDERLGDLLRSSGIVLSSTPGLGDRTTALEMSGMDLWGTQIVFLSACHSGEGSIQAGQGSYGLRHAALIAGAETVVASLWPANAESAPYIVQPYYEALARGDDRITALTKAMKRVRSQQPHPRYWAGFVAVGRSGPLNWTSAVPKIVLTPGNTGAP